MRVLLVNAFSEAHRSRFQAFERSVRTVSCRQTFAQPRQLSLIQVDFDVVDMTSLPKYLYESGSKYMSPDAQKVPITQLFDHTDVVFVDGDANMLPWYHKAERLLVLFRMCQRTKKIVFAAACGMHMLVYLSSCTVPIRRVINGRGKGGSAKDGQTMDQSELWKLNSEDVLLDNTTGDIYQYDHRRQEFAPVGNVGIHYHKAAQDHQIARSSMLKAYTYTPKVVDDPYPIFMGKLNEAKCRVLKQCNQHWLVQGVGLAPFLVPQSNVWDMHPVNSTQENTHVYVLAESDRGPQVVVWSDLKVGVQFHIDPKYKETLTILNNFIAHILSLFEQEETRLDLPIAVAELSRKPGPGDIEGKAPTRLDCYSPISHTESRLMTGSTRPQTAVSRFSSVRSTAPASVLPGPEQSTNSYAVRPNSAVAARHSGFAFSKRFHEPLIVPNNATTAAAIPTGLPTSPLIAQQPTATAQIRLSEKRIIGTNTVVASQPAAAESPAEPTHSEKGSLLTYEYKSQEASAEALVWKRQKEIRAMLHPGYPIDSMPKFGPRIFSKFRSESAMNDKKVIRLKVNRVSFSSRLKGDTVDTFAKTKTTLYPNLGLTVANDGSVYKDPEARKREEEREAKKKWVSHRDFDSTAGKRPGTATVRSYIRLASSEPASSHVFRSESKEKWLAGQFRIGSY